MSFTEVPVVDVSGPVEEVAAALGRAAREVGFMYVSGHGVPDELFEAMLAKVVEFFALPVEEKMRLWIGDSGNHRGYVPEGEEGLEGEAPDLRECFDTSLDLPADDPDHLAGNPMLGPNRWPDVPGFQEAVTAYYTALSDFARRLFTAFAIALGEEPDFFTRHVTKPPSQLRLIHYPFDPAAEDRIGIGAHTDYECFTLLRPTRPGLEVLNEDGEWIDVPPVEGTYVVNIGDMLELWTNGEFVATTHRVRRVREERYSFPLFFNVDYHTRVAPLPRFTTPDRPGRPELVAGEHLFGQTAQTFAYLRDRVRRGEVVLPDGALPLASFGHSRPS